MKRGVWLVCCVFIASSLRGDIVLQFEGRDAYEKTVINKWLDTKKKDPRFLIASIGLMSLCTILQPEGFQNIREGDEIQLYSDFNSGHVSSIFTLDNTRGRYSIQDRRRYIIRLREGALSSEKHLKNHASKEDAERTLFCVEEIPLIK